MGNFKRGMGESIKSLGAESLFLNKLKPDIEAGKVFFAIRPQSGSFYVKGRSLFTYKGKSFSSHKKFVFIPEMNGNYISETKLASLQPIRSFEAGYDEIKKRAVQYADIEATGVSALYKYAPTVKNPGKRYYLVDIEIVFDAVSELESNNGEKKTDRIDILLYDNDDKQLLFCEAKHFSNPEIWESEGEPPRVICQIEGYDKQIAAKKVDIVNQYKIAFAEYNSLMGTKLSEPESVYDNCGLYIFGFNNAQKKELQKRIDANGCFYGHKCTIIGSTGNDSVQCIYEALT